MKTGGEAIFERYLQSGRVHPCMVLVGPDKEAKSQAAISMAKSVFCQEKPEKHPFCGTCSSCKRIEKEIYPDLLFFKEDNEEDLKVETIREIIYQMEVAPLEGRGKVCIIEEAHRMNTASANALLKTLEEPKENRYFVLLSTKPAALLPTLLSRSLVFNFKPQGEPVSFSKEDWAENEKLLTCFLKEKNAEDILRYCEEKETCLRFLQFLQVALRNQAIGEKSPESFKDLNPIDCTLKHQKVVELEGKLRSNANFGLLLESLLRQEFGK